MANSSSVIRVFRGIFASVTGISILVSGLTGIKRPDPSECNARAQFSMHRSPSGVAGAISQPRVLLLDFLQLLHLIHLQTAVFFPPAIVVTCSPKFSPAKT